jgi:subtilisin family serine protease
VTAAYDWIATNHPDADVLNASLGTNALFADECSSSQTWLQSMSQATTAVRANGTLMTASSGNDESVTGIGAPSCLGDVMAVGATYKQDFNGTYNCTSPQVNPSIDDVACFSNVSPELEVLAPGVFMDTPNLGGGTARVSGTSFSAPLVAGCAALIKSAYPDVTGEQLRAALIKTGLPVEDTRVGQTFPRMNCLAAIQSFNVLIFSDSFESP